MVNLRTLGDQDYPPDNGWGWVVCFSSFVVHMNVVGQQYSYGFIYKALLEDPEFEGNSAAVAALGGIASANMYLFSLPAGMLVKRYSTRAVAVLGCVLLTSGLLLSSQVSRFWMLYFTYSGIIGLGYSLTWSPSIIAVNSYFSRKRSLASGIAVAGSGMGTLVYASLMNSLIAPFGWRQTLQIMALVAGVTNILACLTYGTVHHPSAREAQEFREKRQETENAGAVQLQSVSAYSIEDNRELLKQDSTLDEDTLAGQGQETLWGSLSELFDQPPFLPIMLVQFTFCSALWIPYTFLVKYAEDLGHFSSREASILVSTMGISSTVGRVAIGVAGVYLSSILLLQISMFFSGLSMMSLGLFKASTWVIFGAAIVFGVFSGSITALSGPILVEQFGLKKLPLTHGIASLIKAPATALGGPFGGFLLLTTGTYDMTWFIPGLMMCIVSTVLFRVPKP